MPTIMFMIILSLKTIQSLASLSQLGKIQGDGRKFLDRFESYFVSQISSPSLNEVHIYRLQPKSATKGDFVPSVARFLGVIL